MKANTWNCFIALLTAATVIHTTRSTNRVLHEKRTATPREWRQGGRVSADAILPIRIGLVQSNLDDAYEHLMDVSHPQSPNYGRHWKAEDVHEMYAPSSDAVDAVRAWLQDSGVPDVVHSENKV